MLEVVRDQEAAGQDQARSTRRARESHVEADFKAEDTVKDKYLHTLTMTTTRPQRRLLAFCLVFCLVTLTNAVLKDEEAPLGSLSIHVCAHTLWQCSSS